MLWICAFNYSYCCISLPEISGCHCNIMTKKIYIYVLEESFPYKTGECKESTRDKNSKKID